MKYEFLKWQFYPSIRFWFYGWDAWETCSPKVGYRSGVFQIAFWQFSVRQWSIISES